MIQSTVVFPALLVLIFSTWACSGETGKANPSDGASLVCPPDTSPGPDGRVCVQNECSCDDSDTGAGTLVEKATAPQEANTARETMRESAAGEAPEPADVSAVPDARNEARHPGVASLALRKERDHARREARRLGRALTELQAAYAQLELELAQARTSARDRLPPSLRPLADTNGERDETPTAKCIKAERILVHKDIW